MKILTHAAMNTNEMHVDVAARHSVCAVSQTGWQAEVEASTIRPVRRLILSSFKKADLAIFRSKESGNRRTSRTGCVLILGSAKFRR